MHTKAEVGGGVGGFAEEVVEFKQDQLTDGGIAAGLKGFSESHGLRVLGLLFDDPREQDVGVLENPSLLGWIHKT